jgi:hypothetical protein
MSSTQDAVKLLIAERDRIEHAINVLQGGAPRRGRPPKAVASEAPKQASKRKGRRPLTAAEKKAASERMKKIWAARRKAAKKGS